jgi:CxxC motif-containing protein (DUF1111 family)
MRLTSSAARLCSKLVWAGWCIALGLAIGGARAAADTKPDKSGSVAAGYEIFNREWMPNDSRGHGGDGLGPVYNDSSCVACHNSGGSGGAGPVSKNIDILSASGNVATMVAAPAPAPGAASPSREKRGTPTNGSAVGQFTATSPSLDRLAEFHSGFRTGRNVVLHKFGTDPNYDAWRSKVLSPAGTSGPVAANAVSGALNFLLANGSRSAGPQAAGFDVFANQQALEIIDATRAVKRRGGEEPGDGRIAARLQQVQGQVLASSSNLRSSSMAVGEFVVTRSQRNPTPLFGLGLIDAIPGDAIEGMAKRQAKESPEIQGRVSHVKDGRIGRLGWKGQVASVEDFVLNACAVELGLEVPGHHQATIPQAPKYRLTGLDLTSDECASLVEYVKSLPKPVERAASGADETKMLAAGKARFASIGCAGCHSPQIGKVQGIYSDLLLHDMGQEMSDDGSYIESESSGDDEPLLPRIAVNLADGRPTPSGRPSTPRGATRREWRTPPLWGFRDSGPYLHDGRAQTLEQAVAMHGGQGAASALKFFALSPRERLEIEALLKSLVAPPSVQLASR